MSPVQVLSPEVARKIAAGEVIERPFSVVKELVENSLDAGAADIRVDLAGGGKSLIRVLDNGCGMNRSDALLCFERHSTSKFRSEDDLERIATLGFRGEALPSIAAVSLLTIKTSDASTAAGTMIILRPGEEPEVRDTAFPRGTSVEVRDLFFNLPARLKFLRADQTELHLVVKFMTAIAPAYPGVGFILAHGSREVLNWPRTSSLGDRLFQVHGRETVAALMELDLVESSGRVTGFASRPPGGRRDRVQQHFFVNRRPVKDRLLQAALNQAFRGFLEKDLHPEAFVFLGLPYAEVDVNVHPTKAEVRFRDSQLVFRLVLRAVERAVLEAGGVKRLEAGPGAQGAAHGAFHLREPGPREPFRPASQEQAAGGSPPLFLSSSAPGPSGRRVLGQYLDTYIIAADEEGLEVIDQHNAHERVLFEHYRDVRAAGKMPRRQVLVPILFDLSPDRVLRVEESAGLLEEAGFRVEAMGGRTYSLKEFPDIMTVEEALGVFQSLLEEMEGRDPGEKQEKILATLACKTAVKAGERLSWEKMEVLVEALFRLPQHALCPHGRPIVVRLDRSQIERGLKRPSN